MLDEQGVVIGTKRFLAIRGSHPAATYHRKYSNIITSYVERQHCKGGIFLKKSMRLFIDSAGEFKNINSLTTTALLIALHTVLAFALSLQITPSMRISVSFLANVIIGALFGPVIGFVSAAAGDLIQFVIKPTGAFFPGWTLSAALAGMIYGFFFYKRLPAGKKAGRNVVVADLRFLLRCIIAITIDMLLVNILLGTYWCSLMYGKGFWFYLSARFVKNVVQLPINILLTYITLKLVAGTKRKIM